MVKNSITLFFLFLISISYAQKPVFQGVATVNDFSNETALQYQFRSCDIFQFDIQAFDNYIKSAGTSIDFELQLGSAHQWDISLQPKDMRSPNFIRRTATDEGTKTLPKTENLTFGGYLNDLDGGRVALTVDHNFLYGFIEKNGEQYFIEPLWYFMPDQPTDLFVVYAASDVIEREGAKCGLIEMSEQMKKYSPEIKESKNGSDKMMGCVEVDVALAADFSMFQKYGSSANAEAHIMGVMFNVQTNYDDEFNDEIRFSLIEFFTVSTAGGDPWTNSTDPGNLLGSFTNWAPGGFFSDHDLGGLWTNRNFNGSTIGIAWLSSVCSGAQYHAIQDFTTNGCLMRVVVAHEIGHNFSATHNSGIMAPSVNCTDVWSGTSLNQINGFYPSLGCLSSCGISAPPIADFTAAPTEGCAPLLVQFTDLSLNTPSSWNWAFPGGTPSSSTQQNPLVVYNSGGVFDVSLTVDNNAGSNTTTLNSLVIVEELPTSLFSFGQDGLTVNFINQSVNADDYFWDFGDGNTSTLENPVHAYATDGFYLVRLIASNMCGDEEFSMNISVFTQPTANFSASPTEGCAGIEVTFTDQSSSNVEDWNWTFNGGTPASSTQSSPTVTYSNPGTYSVTLTVSNPAGEDFHSKTDFITVGSPPVSGFSSSVVGSMATFVNSSSNINGLGALTFLWDFGDGNTSTEENPVHTYTTSGTFIVILTVSNGCGNSEMIQPVTIEQPPVAAFTANTNAVCEGGEVSFSSTSSNADAFVWSFPGGIPSSSTLENPTVFYNTPGSYSVSLEVVNVVGSDMVTTEGFITVNPLPTPNFSSTVSGLTVNFTNLSSEASSYFWDFGDGSTSSSTNPFHTYAADGIYQVELTATNGCGSVSTINSIAIVTAPTANFSAGATAGCAPFTVQFNNQSSDNAVSFAWTFEGGSPATSTQENPTVTFATAGTYDVSLTVINTAGSSTFSQSNYVVVDNLPQAGFTTNMAGNTATFTNTSANATDFSWSFGDGNTSNDISPQHQYMVDGDYTVQLMATNQCGSVSMSGTVVIITAPTANFSSGAATGCAPFDVQFNNQSSDNAVSFLWTFEGGSPATSTQENPMVTFAAAGTYNVSLTATNSAGNSTTSETGYIAVNAVPSSSFTASTDVFIANFNNTSNGATSYNWNFGDSQSSTDASPQHVYVSDGTYTVTLTSTNECGSSSTTLQLVITSLPQAGFSASQIMGCDPFEVQFNNQSSSNSTSWMWQFPGGSPVTSTSQSPTVTYSSTGTFSVTLTATNSLGENTSSETDYITVVTVPNVGFTTSTNMLVASFNNSSSGASSYSWDFGDGNSSTDESPSHTYNEDGIYEVTLSATNGCGTVVFTEMITIVSAPSAGFTANAVLGCAPFAINFSNQSSANATSFEWQFEGGNPTSSTDENPAVTYLSAGVFNVTLKVSNAAGEDETVQMEYITAGTTPNASFTATLDGATATFDNGSTNPANSGNANYEWDFGDSQTSTTESPVHSYTADGTYDVTLTVTNDCGSSSISGQITIITAPTAIFSTAQATGCQPFEVQFLNESTANAESFAWEFPGGTPTTSTSINPIITYNAPGTYDVTLTVSNAAGIDTETMTSFITVDPMPVPSFVFMVTDSNVDFENQSAEATSYVWDFGDGETSTDENPSHTYIEDSAFIVTLTATNECGSTTTTNIVVIATEGPVAAFSVGSQTGCLPYEVTFNNLSSDNATSYEWFFEGGEPTTSSEVTPTVVYNMLGEFEVMLIATNDIGSDTFTVSSFINVGTVPTPIFTPIDEMGTVTFNNNSINATSYEWDFGDGETSTEVSPEHVYEASGEYAVTLTTTNECGSSASTQTISVIITGVDEIPGIVDFNIFPNPNNGHFTMTLRGAAINDLRASFTNLLGQVIFQEKLDFRTGQLTKEFVFEGLAAGVYIFQLKSGSKSLYKKIVVE